MASTCSLPWPTVGGNFSIGDASAGEFDSGLVNAGVSFKHTFDVAGDYKYICTPHEAMGMIGTIKVT